MKRILLLSFALLSTLSIAFAQKDVDERIQEAREKFFTSALQLSPEESKAFWPIYNEYQEADNKLEKQYRPDRKLELMSDDEVEQYVNSVFEMEEKQTALKRTYVAKMKQAIPIRKIAMLPRTEKQFKKELLQKIREKRQQPGSRNKFQGSDN